MTAPTPLLFDAPCEQGHAARWILAPANDAQIRPEHFTIRCPVCEPPPAAVVSNPSSFPFQVRRTA